MKNRNNGYKVMRSILPFMNTTCPWCKQPLDIQGIKRYIKFMETPKMERGLRVIRKHIDVTIDHKYPVSKGGTDDIKNLQLMHRICNEEKGGR